jgi:hypothetical protein
MIDKPTADHTAVTITIDGRTFTGSLARNAPADVLAAQLPLTLSFTDYGGQEKIARLPEPLPLDGVPAGSDADPLTIGYYEPGQNLVLYYEHVGYFNGIVRLGTLDDFPQLRDHTAVFTATIAKLN